MLYILGAIHPLSVHVNEDTGIACGPCPPQSIARWLGDPEAGMWRRQSARFSLERQGSFVIHSSAQCVWGVGCVPSLIPRQSPVQQRANAADAGREQ